ncbi:glycosyltransferase family 2 protein [Chitinophaga cymbidii]|uniref:Glycosyl transferase n=1 Tax=Chitinophaga cymbidii TaxID=1096750 RepID=A0A512RGJ3_9BACT|nr:glycosyltransferase [Chitinophaga cymbidii]GEP94788.1 glycosyl transferase [Chitinophaga cymbidii]
MGLSVIVVNYNGELYLESFFESLFGALSDFKSPYEILVYDNNSTDASTTMLDMYYATHDNIRLFKNADNIGFARSNNFLVKKAKFKNLLLINNDTRIIDIRSIINKLNDVKELDKEIISCQILNEDLTVQQNIFSFPNISRLLIQLFLLKNLFKKIVKQRSKSKVLSNCYFSGCFIILSKTLFEKVGGFDEDYFFYHEEADLFLKMEKHNIQKIIFDDSKIVHYGGGGGPISEFAFRNYFISLYILYAKHYFKSNRYVLQLLFLISFYYRYLLIFMGIPFNPSPLATIYKGQLQTINSRSFLKKIHKTTLKEILKR